MPIAVAALESCLEFFSIHHATVFVDVRQATDAVASVPPLQAALQASETAREGDVGGVG